MKKTTASCRLPLAGLLVTVRSFGPTLLSVPQGPIFRVAAFLAVFLAAGWTATPLGAASRFRRADVDVDGVVNITDVISILGHLFLGSPARIDCRDAADVDDNGAL